MSTFKTSFKYWLQIFLIPIYWMSFLWIRNKNIWVLGSTFGRRFADNPKYFYLYLNQYQRQEVRPIWITHNKEVVQLLRENHLEVYYYLSLKGVYYCLRSGVYIFDNYSKDISFWLSGGAIKINLWHGTGTKKINQDNKYDYVRHPRNGVEKFKTALRRISDEKPSHYALATSKSMSDILASAFGCKSSHVFAVGHPRNDILFKGGLKDIFTPVEKDIINKLIYYKNKGKRIIFYAPTFRDSESMFFDIVDMDKWNTFLAEHNYVLFTKLHVKSKLKEQFKNMKLSNIKDISADIDTYTVLSYAEMLVVDYSSIYLDYMMLNRPVICFPYDYEVYLKNSRECYFDYKDFMPEVEAKTMEELLCAIESVFKEDVCTEERKKRRSYHFDNIDGNSCERLYNRIIELLNNK